jgi:hypothetical protein
MNFRKDFEEKFVRTRIPAIITGCNYERFKDLDLSVEAVSKVGAYS